MNKTPQNIALISIQIHNTVLRKNVLYFWRLRFSTREKYLFKSERMREFIEKKPVAGSVCGEEYDAIWIHYFATTMPHAADGKLLSFHNRIWHRILAIPFDATKDNENFINQIKEIWQKRNPQCVA